MKRAVEYLIVGQGLAGTHLAMALRDLGRSFLVVDGGHERAASRVAAGLLNPVTGPRLRLTWQAADHLEAARRFYRQQEEELGFRFFQERSIWRWMGSEAETKRWAQRRADPAYTGFLGDWHPAGSALAGLRPAPVGLCEIPQAASIDPAPYLQAARQWLAERSLLWEVVVPPAALEVGPEGVRWGEVTAQTVVFCQGAQTAENPWFGAVPFQHAKGEIIEIVTETGVPPEVVSFGKWLLPLAEKRARVGSTFGWEQLDWTTTAAARRELLGRVKAILPSEARPRVVAQEAGLRPCSTDTKPLLGRHPLERRMVLCNGFGAKGALTTPLCTRRLARHLVLGEPLHPEEDLARLREVKWSGGRRE